MVVGYHADASRWPPRAGSPARSGTGATSTPTSSRPSLAGDFTGSEYNANYRVGYKDGANPFVQSTYGPMVDRRDQGADRRASRAHLDDGLAVRRPGHGPGRHVLFADGEVARLRRDRGDEHLFVEGVVGEIPQG